MYGNRYRYNKAGCVLTELSHLRYIRNTGLHPTEVIKLDIRKKEAHCEDIRDLSNFTKLEKIYMITDEERFVPELLQNIHLFENLYDLSIGLKVDKYNFKELVDGNCHDIADILLIKLLEPCVLAHEDGEAEKCINCYAYNALQNTESSNCVIQNFINDSLLNSMSPSVKKLIIVINHNPKFELTNLPFSLEKLTIVYKTLQKPQEFYDTHKSKIRLPHGCKLKIIQDYDISHLEVDDRHLNITNG